MLVISLMVMLWTVPLLRCRVRCVVLVRLVTSVDLSGPSDIAVRPGFTRPGALNSTRWAAVAGC